MTKVSFLNDYSETGCPEIIEKLAQIKLEKNLPYMNDLHTKNAKQYIRGKIGDSKAEILFMTTGTQVNIVAAAAYLRPHEAIICVEDAHINVHETGSIEATGHKCIPVKGSYGKVTVEDIEEVCGPKYWDNAGILCVKPKMVYISQTTEIGTFYTKEDLIALREICDKYNLYLYCDGARLGSALACSDVTLECLAKYTDSFYIGGAKNGAIFGEALVILNDRLKTDIGFIAKQNGAVLAKGWIISFQFEILMQNGLYEKNGIRATKMAMFLYERLKELDLKFFVESKSNQIFPILSDEMIFELKKNILFDIIDEYDDNSKIVRFVTNWMTKVEDINYLIDRIKEIKSIENL